MELWYNNGSVTLDNAIKRPNGHMHTFPPHETQILQSVFEGPDNVQTARKDAVGPLGRFTTFFRAPMTANYTFLSAADDLSRVCVYMCVCVRMCIHSCVCMYVYVGCR